MSYRVRRSLSGTCFVDRREFAELAEISIALHVQRSLPQLKKQPVSQNRSFDEVISGRRIVLYRVAYVRSLSSIRCGCFYLLRARKHLTANRCKGDSSVTLVGRGIRGIH